MLSSVLVLRVIEDKETSARLFLGEGCIRNSLFYVHESHRLILKVYLNKCQGCLWDTWLWCIPSAARGCCACCHGEQLLPPANISRNVP